MSDDNESKGETCDSPENPKKSKAVQCPKRNRKPKGKKTESKENEPPRRNPMRQVRLTPKQDGASTSGCTSRFENIPKVDCDDDELPILPPSKQKEHVFKPQTIEEMIQEQKELAEEKKKLAEVNAKLNALIAAVDAFENRPRPVLWVAPDPTTMKNCKHLTFDQIKESFEKHKDSLLKIFNGEMYHTRHEAYHKPSEMGINLNAPLGLSLFEYKQLEFIVLNMIEAFDPENQPKMWKYFFQVLAPEFCLLVFMDTHNMTRDEAVRYLVPCFPK